MNYTTSMKILLIGGSSYLGARLYCDLRDTHDVVATYNDNKLSNNFIHLDITDHNEVFRIIKNQKPDVIIHAANYASSSWCKEHPEEAKLLNQVATEYIVDAANEINAKMIFISSMAAVNPSNLYGESKVTSEEITKKCNSGYLILRPSLIVGYSPNTENDRPFNRILNNVTKGLPAVYEDSWNFQPTYIGHISKVIEACIKKGLWNQTFEVVVPKVSTRYKLSKDILSHFNIEVEKETTEKPYFKDEDISIEPLVKNKLPTFSYSELVDLVVEEIKDPSRFTL